MGFLYCDLASHGIFIDFHQPGKDASKDIASRQRWQPHREFVGLP